jgi:hypothetical protein
MNVEEARTIRTAMREAEDAHRRAELRDQYLGLFAETLHLRPKDVDELTSDDFYRLVAYLKKRTDPVHVSLTGNAARIVLSPEPTQEDA